MKQYKVRYEEILTKDIVDVWRLWEKYAKEVKPQYPCIDEEIPDNIRAYLYNAIASSRFIGFIARHGRKPIGMIVGLTQQRTFGSPRTFYQIACLFVEPGERKKGIAKELLKKAFGIAKLTGVHAFEVLVDPENSGSIQGVLKDKGKLVSCKIGGKITLE